MNNTPNFLEPHVKQYGSHMVMTNIIRPTKRKYINFDTKFRDENSYNFTLPDRIVDVKSMIVCNAEIPITFYNISENLGNNYFQILNVTTKETVVITIPDGQYGSIGDLTGTINTTISTTNFVDISFGYTNTNSVMSNNSPSIDYYLNFNVDSTGNCDKYNFKQKLGWLLGYRKPTYRITNIYSATPSGPIVSESLYDLNGLRYLYLVIDEYTNGNQSSFVVPNYNFSLTKANIIARIAMNSKSYYFNSILPANNFNGYLLTDRRYYTGKVDIQKVKVQLVTDLGKPINLNGSDFSFCVEVEHE